jgi:hypothetical protein
VIMLPPAVQADTTGDGYIEFREFVAWWTN